MVPFLRFGEAMCGGPHFPLTSDALKKVLTGQASQEVLLSIAHAVGGQFDIWQSSLSFSLTHAHTKDYEILLLLIGKLKRWVKF